MPNYAFLCENCHYKFEIFAKMTDIGDTKPKCPKCNSSKIYRNYSSENIRFHDAAPKTIGALADKNNSKISEDERIKLTKEHNEYKKNLYTGPLPDGIERKV